MTNIKTIAVKNKYLPLYESADHLRDSNGNRVEQRPDWVLEIVYYSLPNYPKPLEVQRHLKWDDKRNDFTHNIFYN